jgi:hypothetical protein
MLSRILCVEFIGKKMFRGGGLIKVRWRILYRIHRPRLVTKVQTEQWALPCESSHPDAWSITAITTWTVDAPDAPLPIATWTNSEMSIQVSSFHFASSRAGWAWLTSSVFSRPICCSVLTSNLLPWSPLPMIPCLFSTLSTSTYWSKCCLIQPLVGIFMPVRDPD